MADEHFEIIFNRFDIGVNTRIVPSIQLLKSKMRNVRMTEIVAAVADGNYLAFYFSVNAIKAIFSDRDRFRCVRARYPHDVRRAVERAPILETRGRTERRES